LLLIQELVFLIVFSSKYVAGEKLQLKPYSGCLDVDFGKGVGRRSVYLLYVYFSTHHSRKEKGEIYYQI
jgi:hypothetical protein